MKTDRTTPATERQRKKLKLLGIDSTGMTVKQASQALNPQHGKKGKS